MAAKLQGTAVSSAGPAAGLPAPSPERRSLITRAGEKTLRAELERRRSELAGFAERLRDARAFGDAADNDEYLQIKEEEAVLAARIARLEELLATATVVVGADDVANGVASIGTVVIVNDRDSGSVDEHRLVGGCEALTPNAVSANSPIGRALMGRSAGDDVDVQLPRQRTRRLRVAAVRPPD